MKNIFKHIGILFFIIILLFATCGINVYYTRCFCTGKSAVSFFLFDSDKNSAELQVLCNIAKDKKETTCCSSKTNAVTKDVSGTRNCRKSSQEYFKVKSPFIFTSFITPSPFYNLLISVFSYLENFAENEKMGFEYFEGMHPPIFGKTLLKFIHQLKLEIPHI